MKEIKKILIANRGEVALRIIRTCKEMGIKTVTLCPQKGQEEDFIETSVSDEFYYLEKEGAQGYLDIKKILEIAKKARVDAVHPGYGFLSENYLFAKLCEKNKIKFIGPSHSILKKLEDKIEAKKIAQKLKIPVLPFSDHSINSLKDLKKWIFKIRPPFVLKARRGGGGIGIRVTHREVSVGEIFTQALGIKRQLSVAFSDSEFFLESYLPSAKHIEVQIVGDGRKFVHLGERECSLQRRYQKILEEAPSPFLNQKEREQVFEMALRMARFLRYQSVGTVEFLFDPKTRNFYFMEINPRLQVEHPVTECISGIDLVEQQIRISQGEPLRFSQQDVKFSGHALEARILAEDAAKNFEPQAGKITKYIPPGGQGIFLHTFLHEGQNIYPYFDSLLAKLIAWGKDRPEAISKLKRALGEFKIEGVPTTLPFFEKLLQEPQFLDGSYATDFIEKSGILQKILPQQVVVQEVKKEISEEDVARIVFEVLKHLKSKEEKFEREISNWKLLDRLSLFE